MKTLLRNSLAAVALLAAVSLTSCSKDSDGHTKPSDEHVVDRPFPIDPDTEYAPERPTPGNPNPEN